MKPFTLIHFFKKCLHLYLCCFVWAVWCVAVVSQIRRWDSSLTLSCERLRTEPVSKLALLSVCSCSFLCVNLVSQFYVYDGAVCRWRLWYCFYGLILTNWVWWTSCVCTRFCIQRWKWSGSPVFHASLWYCHVWLSQWEEKLWFIIVETVGFEAVS